MAYKDWLKFKFKTDKSTSIGQLTPQTTSYPKNFLPFTNLQSSKLTKELMIYFYNRIPEINSVVTYISQVSANTPLKHVYKQGNGKEKEIKNSPIIKLLNSPNQFDKGVSLKMNMITSFLVTGDIYLNKVIPVGFEYPTKLYLLPSNKMYPIVKGSVDSYGTIPSGFDYRQAELTKYNWEIDNKIISIEPKDIIHIKDSSLYNGETNTDKQKSFLFGQSRLESAISNIECLSNMSKTLNNILGKGGALGFVKKTTRNGEMVQHLSPDQKKDIEDKFYTYSYSQGNGIAFTDSDLNYVKIFDGLAQFMPIELKDYDFKMICKVLGGFPDALMSATDTTFTNLEEAQILLYKNIIQPLVNQLCESLSIGFELPENEKIVADWSNVEALTTDEKEKADTQKIVDELWLNRFNNNLCTENEMLTALNLKTKEDGNRYKKEIDPEPIDTNEGGENQNNNNL